jgi:hypoxanthine phosphoribosyltransferase
MGGHNILNTCLKLLYLDGSGSRNSTGHGHCGSIVYWKTGTIVQQNSRCNKTVAVESSETRLRANVLRLKMDLEKHHFTPDIIIGLSRSGLIAAAKLSIAFSKRSKIPTISLWPHAWHYDNPLNSFDLISILKMKGAADPTGQWKVLIVDDACNSGRSLQIAKSFIEDKLMGTGASVRSAALELDLRTYTQPKDPDFFSEVDGAVDAEGDPERNEETQ